MTIRMYTLVKEYLSNYLILRSLFSLLMILFISNLSVKAQSSRVTSQSGELQIASLEQAYDSQVILILSNHFDRKKFFVDVNIDAEFIEEILQTPGAQTITRNPQSFLPGLPFLPDENLQSSQTTQATPQTTTNQTTYKTLQLNSLAINIYADTSLSDSDLDFMRRVTGFAAKVDFTRGDVINITQLAIPDPDFEPSVVITNTEEPEPKPLLSSFKDYLVEMILLAVFLLGLFGYGMFRNSKDKSNFQSERQNLKSDITLEGSLNPDSNLSFFGSSKEQSRNIVSEFELVSENFFKYPQEVSLVFEFWIDSDEKNGPSNVAEVVSSIDSSSLKLLQNHIDEEKLETIKAAIRNLPPMSIDEKYRAAKYFNSVIEDENTDEKSTKKHAKLGLFKFLTHLSDELLTELIKTENNVSAALIIDYLPEDKAASILNTFERSRAAEIMLKMSTLHTLSYKEQSKISSGLFEKAILVRDNVHEQDFGVENILPILENLPVNEQKRYIEQLKSTGSPVGTILEKEFFTIDQIPELEDEVVKNGVEEIDTSTLLEALVGLEPESIDKILTGRPKREQQLIRLELESINGEHQINNDAKKKLVSSLRKSLKSSKADQQ
ncbi:MAG: FliG C-terminal domain-containing protein [Balneola sp.]